MGKQISKRRVTLQTKLCNMSEQVTEEHIAVGDWVENSGHVQCYTDRPASEAALVLQKYNVEETCER